MSNQDNDGVNVGAMRGNITYKADSWRDAMDDGVAVFSTAQAQLRALANCPETLCGASAAEVSNILHGSLYLLEVSEGLFDSAFNGALSSEKQVAAEKA